MVRLRTVVSPPVSGIQWMSRERQFTLVEMLVVVLVIAVILALLLPALRSAKEKGKQTQCVENLKQIGTALNLYVSDYDGVIPNRDIDAYDGVSSNLLRGALPDDGAPVFLGKTVGYASPEVFGCPSHSGWCTPGEVAKRWRSPGTPCAAAYLYRETDREFNPRLDQNGQRPAVVMDCSIAATHGSDPSIAFAHRWRWTNILRYDGSVLGAANTPVVGMRFTFDLSYANYQTILDVVWDNADRVR